MVGYDGSGEGSNDGIGGTGYLSGYAQKAADGVVEGGVVVGEACAYPSVGVERQQVVEVVFEERGSSVG